LGLVDDNKNIDAHGYELAIESLVIIVELSKKTIKNKLYE